MADARKFTLDISRFCAKAKANNDAIVRKTVLDIGARLVDRSPVGDPTTWQHPPPKGYVGGRFRGSWMLSEDRPKAGALEAGAASYPGADQVTSEFAAIPKDAAGRTFVYVNNVPYAQRLEDGWSQQAPSGMVALTMIEFGDALDAAAKEINK